MWLATWIGSDILALAALVLFLWFGFIVCAVLS